MRTPRIKATPEIEDAVYHCMSRTVNGEFLFDDAAKEVFRIQLVKVGDFCGVRIMSYIILSNHFHLLVRVPRKTEIADAELLRRYRVLHPHPGRYQAARLDVIEHWLRINAPEGVAWRKRMQALMCDVSPFMQLLKQRYSIWFNQNHGRYGTLWSERYKSVLVESSLDVLLRVAAYIDLNCVRAGLASDPKDYRFCSYAEAVARGGKAREGLCQLFGETEWDQVQARYRQTLFSVGSVAKEGAARVTENELRRVILEGGKLPLSDVLRCRLRYLTDGAVLGSKAFVEKHLAAYRLRTGRRQKAAPCSLPAVTEWGELATLRSVRGFFPIH